MALVATLNTISVRPWAALIGPDYLTGNFLAAVAYTGASSIYLEVKSLLLT